MSSDPTALTAEPLLDPLEARILGCLMEKQRTTPDQYPLTLNALVSACNQKSARDPVMTLSPGEVGHAVNRLRDRGLVHASFSGRTERYDHKLVGTFFLSREEQAVLCVLLLRGPQTPGELRLNTARLAEFRDLDGVSETLRALAERQPRLVVELPRTPGRREARYAQLLCGTPECEAAPASPVHSAPKPAAGQAVAATELHARLAALEEEVADLRAQLAQLWELSGLR